MESNGISVRACNNIKQMQQGRKLITERQMVQLVGSKLWHDVLQGELLGAGGWVSFFNLGSPRSAYSSVLHSIMGILGCLRGINSWNNCHVQ